MEFHSKIKNSIILVSFPFDDFSASKVRPALCLTQEIGRYNHIIIAFISSSIPKDILKSDIIVSFNSASSMGTGLLTDSVIRLHKIVTIPKAIIRRKLGVVNRNMQEVIKSKLMQMFE